MCWLFIFRFVSQVLVTGCSFSATTSFIEITVPESSELIFADAAIELRVRTIRVNGVMRMGSPTCRLFSVRNRVRVLFTLAFLQKDFPFQKINITFTGSRAEVGTDGKGIVVAGQLEIHGKLFHPTWTRLAAPVRPGDDRVYLQQAVNWQPGQKVSVCACACIVCVCLFMSGYGWRRMQAVNWQPCQKLPMYDCVRLW